MTTTNPNQKSLKKLIATIPLIMVLGVTTIAGISMMESAYALAWTPDVPGDYEGQEPRYLIFESMGECHQFVKDNPEVGLEKDDCQKGSPPEQPPTEG